MLVKLSSTTSTQETLTSQQLHRTTFRFGGGKVVLRRTRPQMGP